MARIAGVDLPRNKRGVISLTYVFGIGPTRAAEILDRAGVDHSTKVQDWDDENIRTISNLITNEYKVEGDLRTDGTDQYQAFDGHRLLPRPAVTVRACPSAASAPRPTPAPVRVSVRR